jgi:aspartyl aminopeptidase
MAESKESDGNVNCIALFNHEEIGSVSTTGAESSLIPTLVERLSPTPAAYGQSIAKSFLISSDMGHAVHPNYQDKHESKHKPRMNHGIVIKTNAKQRYATDAIGTFLVKKLVESKGGKVQDFEVRNDMSVHVCPVCIRSYINAMAQALRLHCGTDAEQTRFTNGRRWKRDVIDAFHQGDRRIA